MAAKKISELSGEQQIEAMAVEMFRLNFGDHYRKSDAERLWPDIDEPTREYWRRLARGALEALSG